MKTSLKRYWKASVVFMLMFCMIFTVASDCNAVEIWNKGEKLNYQPSNTDTVYQPSEWAKELSKTYQFNWYENPKREVLKGEFMLVQLRTVQAALQRQKLTVYSAPKEKLEFKDLNTLTLDPREEAKILKSLGILSGTPDGYMKLSAPINRGEAAKVLAVVNKEVLLMPPNRPGKIFEDTKTHWAKDVITQAYEVSLLNGTSETKFEPNKPLTIEQTLTILNNEIGHSGIKKEDVTKAMNETFKVSTTALKEQKLNNPVTNKIWSSEEKMKIYGFEQDYDNRSAKGNQNVTKLETLKLALVTTLNYPNFESYFGYQYGGNLNSLFTSLSHYDIDLKQADASDDIKLIDALDYFGKIKKNYQIPSYVVNNDVKLPDISMYSPKQQEIIKDMVSSKVIEVPKNASAFEEKVTKDMLNKIVVNYVENHGLLTGNGDKLNTDLNNIPKNYKNYPYTLASVDKRIYEIENEIYEPKKYVSPVDLFGKYRTSYPEIERMVTDYLNTVLNVDYTNLNEAAFIAAATKDSLFGGSDVRFYEYFDYVRENKIQISGKGKAILPIVYFDGMVYKVRVRVELDIKNANQPYNLIFGDLGQCGKVKYEGKKIVNIFDVAISKYIDSSDFGVYVSPLTPIAYNLKMDTIVVFKNYDFKK